MVSITSAEAVAASAQLCKILVVLFTVRRTLSNLQKLVLAGKFENSPGRLKPFDRLLVNNLRTELQANGMITSGKLKDADLTAILKGAQRPLQPLNLQWYEVLDSAAA